MVDKPPAGRNNGTNYLQVIYDDLGLKESNYTHFWVSEQSSQNKTVLMSTELVLCTLLWVSLSARMLSSFAMCVNRTLKRRKDRVWKGRPFTFNHNLDILGVSQVVVGYIWLVERTGRSEGDVSSGLGPQKHRIHRPTIAEGYGLKHLLPHLQ